jgi:hypothetical protein
VAAQHREGKEGGGEGSGENNGRGEEGHLTRASGNVQCYP